MIDKTYVINLLRRNDKKEHMQNEFRKLEKAGINLNPFFFEAIDGHNTDSFKMYKFNIPNWYDPNSGKAMTNGEIGCALSHYSVWNDIVQLVENNTLKENSKILILEDDVVFLDSFMSKFINYTKGLVYDMLYLHRKPLNLQAETKISPNINLVKKSYWACAYILTYTGAKKLINSNYLDNLLPVDEFLPIMYGSSVLGFEKIYEKAEKLICYAVKPSLLKLTDNAFYESETFHSNPVSNSKYIFDDDHEFLVIYIGPTYGDSYQRFIQYCHIYGLPLLLVNNNDPSLQRKLLQDELNKIPENKLPQTLILCIIVHPSDYADIIPIAPPAEIIEKYYDLVKNNTSKILVAKNNVQAKLSNQKLLFCSWGTTILNFINDTILNSINDTPNEMNNYQNASLQTLFHTNLSKPDTKVIIDTECDIFNILNNDDAIIFNHKNSRIKNSTTGKSPCLVISQDNKSRIFLNRVENYTGNNWNEYYGYKIPKIELKPDPKIYLSFHMKRNAKILKIASMNYPPELLQVSLNRIGSKQSEHEISHNSEEELYQNNISNFLKSDCDYYFFIDHNCVLTNPNILRDLLQMDKPVIAPLIKMPNENWSNFWGDLKDIKGVGYYNRSFDYFDIVNGVKKGCWNMPYVTGTYLIKRDVIEAMPNLLTDNSFMDIDMRICHNLRERNIFMYVLNLDYYGYFDDGELTIYDVIEKRDAWEKKYLHPEYLKCKDNISQLKYTEPCPDIYNFPLFSEDFCKEVIQRMEEFGNWSKGKDEHNDPRLGNNYYENVPTQDIHFFQIKFDKQWEHIVMTYVVPIVRLKYSFYKTKGVHLGFVVKYHWQQQSELTEHHDASTYTINVALNRGGGVDYDGGGCHFVRQNLSIINQPVGMCLIHPGRLVAYHKGLKTTAGIRYILVSFVN